MAALTQYSNVDLVLRADVDLSPLLAELGERVMSLNPGAPHTEATLELDHEGGPNAAINAFCEVVESLSPAGRELWDRCRGRVLDAGFEAGVDPWPFTSDIEAATLGRAARLGASLKITIYPYREPKSVKVKTAK